MPETVQNSLSDLDLTPKAPDIPPKRPENSPATLVGGGFNMDANKRGQKSSRFLETLAVLSEQGAIVIADRAAHTKTQAMLNTAQHMQENQVRLKEHKELTDMDRLQTVPEQETDANRTKYYEMQQAERDQIQIRMRILKAQQEILDAQKKHGLYLSEEERNKFLQNAASNPTANPFSKDMMGLDKALTDQEKQLRKELSSENTSADQNVTTINDMSKGVRLKDGLMLRIEGTEFQNKRKEGLMKKAHEKEAPALDRPTEVFKEKIDQKETNEGTLAAEALRRRLGAGLG